MSIIKIGNRTEKPFAQIDNNVLNDARMSWRAKGILCYLLGRPVDWTIVSEHLVTQGTEGRDAVRTAFQELKELGYATLETHRDTNGKLTGSVWTVHESPFRQPEKPRPENPADGKPATTNTDSTKTDSTKKEAIKNSSLKANRFQKPEIQQVLSYAHEISLPDSDAEGFYDFQESKGWKIGNAPMKDWKAALRTWKRNAAKFSKASFHKNSAQSVTESCDENCYWRKYTCPDIIKGIGGINDHSAYPTLREMFADAVSESGSKDKVIAFLATRLTPQQIQELQ